MHVANEKNPDAQPGTAMIAAPRTRERSGRGLLRRTISAAALVLTLAGTLVAVAAAPAHASWYPASTGGSGVTIRDCYHPVVRTPSTSCTYVAFVPAYTPVRIVCQRSGQNIGGDPVWDYIVWEGGPGRPEGYAADYYINTGYANWIPGVDRCS